MNLVIENTTYSVLIYLLISINWKDTIYIFNALTFPKEIVNKFEKLGVECHEIKYNIYYQKNEIIKYYIEKLKYIYWIKKLYRKNKIENIFGNDNLSQSNYLRNKKFVILEDGLTNYRPHRQTLKIKIKNFLLLDTISYTPYGYEKCIKKIYLTGLAAIPKEIAHKVELINLKELWDKKTLEEQNEILDIFSFDLDIKEKIKGRDIILFTQPLSEDKTITEEEKVEIYSKIIKKYSKDRLIIKTHPREKTNYKNIFKEYLVLNNSFPFEILNLLDIKFKKAITIFSTAALGLGKEVEVDFYGTEIHPKILKRFGSCDNIMKRNCFLEER